jgi:hypothetical protein
MNKKNIIILIISLFVVLLIIVYISYKPPETNGESELEQKIKEIQDLGYTVEDYQGTFQDAQKERLNLSFHKVESWESFKLEVQSEKNYVGPVTVWCHKNEGILWVKGDYQLFSVRASAYYYQVID